MSAQPATARDLPAGAKLGLLGALYLAQGLPFGFFTQALPVLMRKLGYSLGEIGLASLLAAPWALKFLWAPLVDRYGSAAFGRRKSWILPLQAITTVTLAVLAAMAPDGSLRPLLYAVLIVNLLSATQDIATDGLAVDLLAPHERGLANGVQVAGYRLGMIIGGGALLVLFDRLGWSGTFLAMAAIVAAASVPVLACREPPGPAVAALPAGAGDALRRADGGRPRAHFLRLPGSRSIIALLLVYKAGDAFATGMLRPFLVDIGLTLGDVGWLLGTVGFLSGLLGALAGGALVHRIGRRRALVLFGFLQALSVGAYAVCAWQTPSRPELYAICAAEHFASGMATASLFTCMMDWSRPETGATDYTVQASAVVIATGGASAASGFSAHALGYVAHFALGTALALVAVAAAYALFPRGEGAEGAAAAQRA